MPELLAHLSVIKKNLRFLNSCECEQVKISTDFIEWGIVVRFYTCLHIVEATIAAKGIHFFSHDKRNAKIYDLPQFFTDEFCNYYNELYNASKKARYLEAGGKLAKEEILTCQEGFEFILAHAKNKLGITEASI